MVALVSDANLHTLRFALLVYSDNDTDSEILTTFLHPLFLLLLLTMLLMMLFTTQTLVLTLTLTVVST